MAKLVRTRAHHDYEIAVVARKAAEKVGAYDDAIGDLKREERKLAHAVAAKLGHLPLRQNNSVECSRCGRSGSVGDQLTGAVHKEPCR